MNMLVYCSRIFLLPKSPATDVLGVVAEWLQAKTRRPFSAQELSSDGAAGIADSSSVEWITADDADAALHSIRYIHPDRITRNRSWLTEIGVRHDRNRSVCSVLLRTEESSALVDTNVQTTRPLIVRDLFRRCAVAAETSGGKPQPLGLDDAEAFLYEVNNPDRTHPIVQISYTRDGGELVSPDYAAELLAGVATVAVIQPDTDTYALERALERRLCCFDGAVNIIWPQLQTASGRIAPNYRILRHQLLEMRARGYALENEILGAVCNRMNETFARDHLTIESVRAAKHRSALVEARKSAASGDTETIELYRRVDEDQIKQIADLSATLRERDNSVAELRARLQQEEAANEALKHNLANSGGQPESDGSISGDIRDSIARAVSDPFTLRDGLEMLKLLYPTRLVILDSAWKSADAAAKFKYPRKAFELLNRLCTAYWECLNAGKSDAQARECFGNNAFSATESETVEKNKKARSLRTFVYDGRSVEMMMHLKIGVKASVAETFRAHFHWDARKKVIVLGHFGKHLDHG